MRLPRLAAWIAALGSTHLLVCSTPFLVCFTLDLVHAAEAEAAAALASRLVVVEGDATSAFVSAPTYAAFFEQGALRFRPASSDAQRELQLRLEGLRRGAAYPLVLDPLITPFAPIPGSYENDAQPDVAWETEAMRYCVVWHRDYGGTVVHLAHVFEEDGTPVYPTIVLGWSTGTPVRASVCAVNRSASFVAAHYEPGPNRIQVTSIRSSDLGMKKVRHAVSGCYGLDLGGNANSLATEAWLVWNDGGGVWAQQWNVPLFGETRLEAFGESFPLRTGETHGPPRISQTGGNERVWCVVWPRSLPTSARIEGCSLAWTGPGPVKALAEGWNLREPHCCGFYQRFLVAWRDGGANEIAGAEVSVDSTGRLDVELEAVLVSGPDALVQKPEVARVQEVPDELYVVSWREFGGASGDALRYRAFEEGGLNPRGAVQTLTTEVFSARIASVRVATDAMDLDPRRWCTFAVEQPDAIRTTVIVP